MSTPAESSRLCLLALLAGLLLAACEQRPAPPEPLRLGVIVDMSGPSASLGRSGRNGMQLAVEETNANGGIQGRPIELLFRDDGFNPEQAKQAASELIDAGVVAVLGPMTSLIAEQLAPQFTHAGILLMGGTPLSPLLAGRDDQFFRILSHTNQDARDIARYLKRRYDLRQVNVIVEQSNYSYTQPWLTDLRKHLSENGISIGLSLDFISAAQTDFASLAQAALANRPKAVVLISSALDTALLSTQLRLRDPQLILATAAWAAADDLPAMGGRAVEGIVTAQAFDMSDQSNAFIEFQKRYQARFAQNIDTAAVTTYNATRVLLTALQQSLQGEQPKQALLRIRQFQGLQHPIIFDDFGDSDSRLYPMVVRDGRFRSLE